MEKEIETFVSNPIFETSEKTQTSSEVDQVESSNLESGENTLINLLTVNKLSYTPPNHYIKETFEHIRTLLTLLNIGWVFPSFREVERSGYKDLPLHNVSFSCKKGELVCILGKPDERHNLLALLSGRKNNGFYSGSVTFNSNKLTTTDYYEAIAFVQKKMLWVPGLTYEEMLTYSVSLRLKDNGTDSMKELVRQRVDDLIDLMDLSKCRRRQIDPYPKIRGAEGAELRRLSIALEIASLPPVIILDEPTLEFTSGFTQTIIKCLKKLSTRGHTVICSITKPFLNDFNLFDRVVLLSEGYSIYSGSIDNVVPYFTSSNLGYSFDKNNVVLVDWLLDISSGVERPTTQREADLPIIMQTKYETSDYYESTTAPSELLSLDAFSPDFFKNFGYVRKIELKSSLTRIKTIIKRSVYTKFRDFATVKISFAASLFIGLVAGYLQYQMGDYPKFARNLLTIPYANTANLTSLCFFCCIFSWAVPYLNVHVVTQKMQLYRYELKAGCCSPIDFLIGTAIAEVPFTILFMVIFGSLIFGLTRINVGFSNYLYFIEVISLNSIIGMAGSFMLVSMFKKELIVRDFFLVIVILVCLLSGFPFLLVSMTSYLADVTCINPLRWSFEALMAWVFHDFADGKQFLATYGFESFDYKHIFTILGNFIWITVLITFVFLIKTPVLLKKKQLYEYKGSIDLSRNSATRLSVDSLDEEVLDKAPALITRRSTRQSELQKPVLFMRGSSVTGNQAKLSVNLSLVGEENSDKGPNVQIKDLYYFVPDAKATSGFKTILHGVSGQFSWGNLSLILGSSNSGKTTLLQVLAGDIGLGAQVYGSIFLNGKKPTSDVPLYQRCAFVPAQDEHMRDLTVKDVLLFASKLRSLNAKGFSVIDENINRTVEILQLNDILDKKTKNLNPGELKRLSIAEEVVHGPKLILIDEPTTGISLHEISILLLTLREMANQERTVITTLHQPPASALTMFDTLMLLSYGRVIYHGPAKNASAFFLNSPYGYCFNNYSNPADFYDEISAGLIPDHTNAPTDLAYLEKFYKTGEFYGILKRRLHEVENSYMVSSNPNHVHDTIDTSEVIPTPVKSKPAALLYLEEVKYLFFENGIVELFQELMFKGPILFSRSFYSLLNRKQLIISSTLLHMLLAVLFGWIMGDSYGNKGVYNTTSFFAIGSMFLIFANVCFVFYLYNNQQVFLKESSRKIYSPIVKWLATDYTFLFLRITNGIFYIIIFWYMTNQEENSDLIGFSVFSYIIFSILTAVLTDCVIYVAVDKRACYTSITGLAFVNFVFSGLFIKSYTLPQWLAPWATSLSMIRWNMQGNFISTYKDNPDAFPTLPNGYSVYNSFLSLFGWGGKTAWFCFSCLIIMIIVYRCLGLFFMIGSIVSRKGGKRFVDQPYH